MLTKVKKHLPPIVKAYLKKFRLERNPPIVSINKFSETGCKFYAATSKERYRIETLDGEDAFLASFLSEIKPGDIVFDVGSCLGLFAIHAAKFGAKVFAFEPDPSFRRRLKQNIRLNHLQRKVTIVPWAVSDSVGKIALFTDGIEGNSPSLRDQGNRDQVIVSTNYIDNAIRNNKLPVPRIIKMDIEGAEIMALRGMGDLLKCSNDLTLFIELHPDFLVSFGATFDDCTLLVESFGFKPDELSRRSNQVHCIYRKVKDIK